MPVPVTFNRLVDRQQAFQFTLKIRDKDTGDYVDISTWQFHFLMKNAVDQTIWNVHNSEFLRPDNFTITFTKTVSEVGLVLPGNYTISLLVTKTDMTDNEYLTGIWAFRNS